MHVDGFRFDLGSILTRAHSTWHPTEPLAEGESAAPLSGEAATDGHGTRLYSPENGIMKLRLLGFTCQASTSLQLARLRQTVPAFVSFTPSSGGRRPVLDVVPRSRVNASAIGHSRRVMTDGAGVPTGTPLTDPPLVEAISEDPVLRDTKLIAEAWDCDGLNQARHPLRQSPARHAAR